MYFSPPTSNSSLVNGITFAIEKLLVLSEGEREKERKKETVEVGSEEKLPELWAKEEKRERERETIRLNPRTHLRGNVA